MKQQIEKVKTHFRENKKVYIAATVGVVVGAASVFIFYRSGNKATIDSWKLVQYRSPHTSQTIQVALPRLGHPGNAVQCIENGTVYASQGEAARAFGVNPGTISKVLKGKQSDICGHTFKKITEAGVPVA